MSDESLKWLRELCDSVNEYPEESIVIGQKALAALPALLDEVERLRKEVHELQAMADYVASQDSW